MDYNDWASGWTQHWWTGGGIDRPTNDPALPRVESDLHGASDVLFHLLAHEIGHVLAYDYRPLMRRGQSNTAFEPGDFGFLSWISPGYTDSTGWHDAVARKPRVQVMRTLDFDGNVSARLAMRGAMEKQGAIWDAGVLYKWCSRDAPGRSGYWAPDPETVSLLESALGPALDRALEQRIADPSRRPAANEYFRQYIGIRSGRRPVVYINGFHKRYVEHLATRRPEFAETWRTRAVNVCDGGSSFFGAEYDPATRQIANIRFNGPG